ncbi:hypothetical protein ASV53_06060 [Photobacterium sanguinicancri]|uniref:Uncharacterized protein n=1 Tax=Photobacterium sanguinicancri TaxID=875932 RepID=A0ABX4G2J2_9GAMM|nr:hypothetical protein ASV53_06060 [Photobacterium sanguinicancri]
MAFCVQDLKLVCKTVENHSKIRCFYITKWMFSFFMIQNSEQVQTHLEESKLNRFVKVTKKYFS